MIRFILLAEGESELIAVDVSMVTLQKSLLSHLAMGSEVNNCRLSVLVVGGEKVS